MASMDATADVAAGVMCEYASTLCSSVPDAHFVVSPVGAWLLLALTAPAAPAGNDRRVLEGALGLEVEAAQTLAASLLADPHPALAAAAAVWCRSSLVGPAFDRWRSGLPPQVEQGPIPIQAAADHWARVKTLGLVDEFPLALGKDQQLVLVTAVATSAKWIVPFDTAPSSALGGPWSARVDHVLRGTHGMLVKHGGMILGVHLSWSRDGLTVLSVIGDKSLQRPQVLAAAQELAAARAAGREWAPVDLWELAPGSHGYFTVNESGAEIAGTVTMPAWESTTSLDLSTEETLGLRAAARSISALLRPANADIDSSSSWQSRQRTVARFNRVGFEAGAVTGMLNWTRREGPFRSVDLTFGHPYAVVAYLSEPGVVDASSGDSTRRAGSIAGRARTWPGAAWQGLPAFSAWVGEPTEAESDAVAG